MIAQEVSDQSAHFLDSQGCKVSSCRQRRLIRLCGCAGWFESSLGAHVRRYVFSRCGSFYDLPVYLRYIQLFITSRNQSILRAYRSFEWSPDQHVFGLMRIAHFEDIVVYKRRKAYALTRLCVPNLVWTCAVGICPKTDRVVTRLKFA